jgi:hypothetical protein
VRTAANAVSQPWSVLQDEGRSCQNFILVRAIPPDVISDLTVHFTSPKSVLARCESRLIRTKTVLSLRTSTAKAGSIATAHRLRHAWLASHRRAPSLQSKSPINPFASDIKHQAETSIQIAAWCALWCCRNTARFATGLAAGASTGDWSLRWIFRRRLLSIIAPSQPDTDFRRQIEALVHSANTRVEHSRVVCTRREEGVRVKLVLELGGPVVIASRSAAFRHGSFQLSKPEQNILADHEQRPHHQQLFRYVVVTAALRSSPSPKRSRLPYLHVAGASPFPPPRIVSSLSHRIY